MNLATKLERLESKVCVSPWADHEHYRGYAVLVLPFSSGHLLGLRVFPENDFFPYRSVWHRSPDGGWCIYNDGPLKTGCPRAWGPVLEHSERVRIELEWTGPNELRVEMESPRLVWTMRMSAPPLLRVMNRFNAALPLVTWRPAPLVQVRAAFAKYILGLGDLQLAFVTPTRREMIVMPEQLYSIPSSSANWEGSDLGGPVMLEDNPTIGEIPLPSRPTFMIGQAQARIDDWNEYEQARREVQLGRS